MSSHLTPLLLLASTSVYRRELLSRLACPFEVARPGVDEAALPGELPMTRARRLAVAKAKALAQEFPEHWILGSDQVAEVDGQVLDKPGNAARCAAQLETLSGRTANFHTAVALARGADCFEHCDLTRVVFRRLAADEIDRYVAFEQPFDCAGGFKCEGLGITLFERVESVDPSALVGLPLIWVAGALRRVGFRLP